MLRQLVGIAVALALLSCSFVAVKRLPDPHEPGDEQECTSSLTYPLVDTTVTVLAGVLAVSLLAAGTGDDEREEGLRSAGFATGGVALLHLASATWGTVFISRCRRAQRIAGGPAKDPVVDRPRPGSLGGPCRKDGSCDGELMCDAPMNTCIPILDNGEDF